MKEITCGVGLITEIVTDYLQPPHPHTHTHTQIYFMDPSSFNDGLNVKLVINSIES